MMVKVLGFNWRPGKTIFLQEFLNYLVAEQSLTRDNFIMGVTKIEGYWAGVLLTIRDQTQFCKIRTDGGDFTITAEGLKEGENPVEVNFFLIKGSTGRGIYQHYHHSSSLNIFCKFSRYFYGEYKTTRINADIKPAMSQKQIAACHTKYQNTLRFSFWVRPQALPEALALLKEIHTLDVQIESVEVKEKDFLPIAQISKSVRHRFRFEKQTSAEKIRSVIRGFLKTREDIETLSVEGIDGEGDDLILKLENNLDRLAVMDYEEVVKDLIIRSSDLQETIENSAMVKKLLTIAKSPDISAMLETPLGN